MNNLKLKTSNSGELLTIIFSKMDHDERANIFNLIDDFIINQLNIDKEHLPWLNGKKKHEDYVNLVVLIRLAVAKIFNDYQIKIMKKGVN